MRTRRTFSREFKISVLKESEVKPPAEVCREHDIHPVLLTKWKNELQQNPKGAFAGHGKISKFEAQIAERDRLIGQLYAENAFLKKVMQRSLERRAEEKLGRRGTK